MIDAGYCDLRSHQNYLVARPCILLHNFGNEFIYEAGVASGLCLKLKIKIPCPWPVKLAKENGLPGP